MNLTDSILRHARMQPRSVALIEREQTMTYGELADRILRTAGYLATLGIVRGDHVGLCLKEDSQLIVVLLALVRLGAIGVQIDSRSRPAERTRVIDAFPMRLALVTPESKNGVNSPREVLEATLRSA